MREIKPDYYDRFVCVADQCPMTCCQEWKIAVDDKTRQQWKKVVPPEILDEKSKVQKKNLAEYTCMKDGAYVIEMEKDHKCPFLDQDKLCRLVIAYGEEILSETCHVFPREVHEFGSRKEYSLMPCCPVVIDILKELDEVRWIGTDEKEDELLFSIRSFFCNLMKKQEYTPDAALLLIYYIALDLLEESKDNEAVQEKLAFYQTQAAMQELWHAIDEVVLEAEYTFEERNELFLDLAENYRREGLYQELLGNAAVLAESYGENYEKESIIEELAGFLPQVTEYEKLFRNFLVEELYADLLLPGGTLEDMVIKLQWIAMEYAAIRQILFLHWKEKGTLAYETVRKDMVVICRMMGYDEEDIHEYLENSFESLIWDWGYFALIVGKVQ